MLRMVLGFATLEIQVRLMVKAFDARCAFTDGFAASPVGIALEQP